MLATELSIQKEKKEFVLTKQILKAATSIGANAEEVVGGYSDKDFVHKLSIVHKEALETKYWIRLWKDSEIIEDKVGIELIDNIKEI